MENQPFRVATPRSATGARAISVYTVKTEATAIPRPRWNSTPPRSQPLHAPAPAPAPTPAPARTRAGPTGRAALGWSGQRPTRRRRCRLVSVGVGAAVEHCHRAASTSRAPRRLRREEETDATLHVVLRATEGGHHQENDGKGGELKEHGRERVYSAGSFTWYRHAAGSRGRAWKRWCSRSCGCRAVRSQRAAACRPPAVTICGLVKNVGSTSSHQQKGAGGDLATKCRVLLGERGQAGRTEGIWNEAGAGHRMQVRQDSE